MNKFNKICCMGLGYIGLPTSTVFAVNGYEVVGVDVQQEVVDTINDGSVHIQEPGLKEMVRGAVMEGNLQAGTDPEPADVFIIAVPTPLTEGKSADLSYVREAAETISSYLEEGNLVIVESTVAPRTTVDIVKPELESSGMTAGEDFYLAHCPERVLPGQIIHELIHNNRIIGGIDEESALKACELYNSFVEGEMYITDATTAELTKLMENTYRDVNIAFANELARVAEDIKTDVWEAIDLANKHPRVNIHKPGPGVGGHCLAVDPWFIMEKAPRAEMIELSREINDSMPEFVVSNVKEKLFGIGDPKISILGITYKGNVDDTRESPILKVIELFAEDKVGMGIHDPRVPEKAEKELNLLALEEAVKGSDCIIIGADHKEFNRLDPEDIGELMNNRVIFDTKNHLEAEKWEEAGFEYYKLGDYSHNDWHKNYGVENGFNCE